MEANVPEGYQYIKSSGGIDEYRLGSNDLSVLLMEDHSAPVATVMVTYRVGSRNEAPGHTGATHLLEHLMFKGSTHFNKENGKIVWNLLETKGARVNATTYYDRTNYFELLPREYIENALALEADRMRNAYIRAEDKASEMTVVRNEYERGENDPAEALDKAVWAAAFTVHPYRYPVIGSREDIEGVPVERLKQFYDTFYWPNNATATVIGDFDAPQVLSLIKKYFGEHPRSPEPIPQVTAVEPPQKELRRITVSRSGEVGIVSVSHKAPAGRDADTHAFLVLTSVLGTGRTGRLYRALTDKGLTSRVFMFDNVFHDPGLCQAYAYLTPGTGHEQVEKIIFREYEKVRSGGVTGDELSRAKEIIRASTAFSRDGSYSVAANLNEAIALGDWTFYTTFMDKISAVTSADVRRVAQTYLTDERSTVGHFIPKHVAS